MRKEWDSHQVNVDPNTKNGWAAKLQFLSGRVAARGPKFLPILIQHFRQCPLYSRTLGEELQDDGDEFESDVTEVTIHALVQRRLNGLPSIALLNAAQIGSISSRPNIILQVIMGLFHQTPLSHCATLTVALGNQIGIASTLRFGVRFLADRGRSLTMNSSMPFKVGVLQIGTDLRSSETIGSTATAMLWEIHD